MVRPKYLSRDTSRGPALWWYPYGEDLRRLLLAAGRALHGRTFFGRLRAQLRLLTFPRVWRRFGPLRILQGLDKLF
jgi:hypothetical protein